LEEVTFRQKRRSVAGKAATAKTDLGGTRAWEGTQFAGWAGAKREGRSGTRVQLSPLKRVVNSSVQL